MQYIAIFGASKFGEQVLIFLKEYFPDIRVKFFLDNDKSKQEFLNMKVFRPDEVNLNSVKIFVASDYYSEIKKQLINKGLSENIDFFSSAILYNAKVDIHSCQLILKKFEKNDIKYRIVDRKELRKNKSSNKLFIFGSGRTLNDLTEKEIEHIQQHDSWMLNFSNTFKITPTYASFEFVGDKIDYFKKLTSNVKNRDSYPLTYIKDLHYYSDLHTDFVKKEFDNMPITLDIRLHTKDIESLNSTLHLIKYLKLDELFSQMNYNLGGVTSVTTVMFHALALGYEEVILCGVDLNKDIYFFEESMESVFDKQLAKYPIRIVNKEAVHSTMSEEFTIPADIFIYMINELFFKDEGISLRIASSKSLLYPKLSLYDFG